MAYNNSWISSMGHDSWTSILLCKITGKFKLPPLNYAKPEWFVSHKTGESGVVVEINGFL